MKNIFTFLFTLLTIACFAQVPQGVSYQAVAFNSGGTPVANGTVGVKVSVLDNSTTGTVVYSEIHNQSTNAQGLFNLNIGQGTPTSGTFSGIDWGTNTKFLKVEVDPTGGTSYTNVGVNQLMSVPYALFAEESNSVVNGGGSSFLTSSGNFLIYDDFEAKVWNSQTATWSSTTFSNYIDSAVVLSGNFVVYDDFVAKVWNSQTATWSATTFSNYIDNAVASNGDFLVYDDFVAKVWNSQTATWSSTTFSNYIDNAVASNGNFIAYDDFVAKVWNSQTATWSSTTFSNYIDNAVASNGNFIAYDDFVAKVWNSQTATWSSTTFSNYIDNAITD